MPFPFNIRKGVIRMLALSLSLPLTLATTPMTAAADASPIISALSNQEAAAAEGRLQLTINDG
jgi:hypothetical protein